MLTQLEALIKLVLCTSNRKLQNKQSVRIKLSTCRKQKWNINHLIATSILK
jgi:hypothetical protein